GGGSNQDTFSSGMDPLGFRQHVQAVNIRETQIRNHNIKGFLLQPADALSAIRRGHGLKGIIRKDHLYGIPHEEFIINNKYALALHNPRWRARPVPVKPRAHGIKPMPYGKNSERNPKIQPIIYKSLDFTAPTRWTLTIGLRIFSF